MVMSRALVSNASMRCRYILLFIIAISYKIFRSYDKTFGEEYYLIIVEISYFLFSWTSSLQLHFFSDMGFLSSSFEIVSLGQYFL